MLRTKQSRYNEIIELREQGLNYRSIGEIVRLSPQGVANILSKDYIGKDLKCSLCGNHLLLNEKRFCSECNLKKLTGREAIREKIRIRDNHTCQICGKRWEEGQRRFDVHHIDCDKEKSRQYDVYDIEKDNLITLCHKCHLNLPEHKKAMTGKRDLK